MSVNYLDLEDARLNVDSCDGFKCRKCRKPIEVKYYFIEDGQRHYITPQQVGIIKNQGIRVDVDRTNRIDCDGGRGERQRLVSFHKQCWYEAIFGNKDEDNLWKEIKHEK